MRESSRLTRCRRLVLSCRALLLIVLASACFGQTAKPFTNDDIKQMVAGGLNDDTIALAIHSHPCQFDTSVPALTDLRNSRVSQRIVELMLAATPATPSKAEAPGAAPTPPRTEPAAMRRPVCDLASLNLGVESARVVGAINSITGTAAAPEGMKIVVVHLKAANHPRADCEWLSSFVDIEAVYPVPAKPNEIPYAIVPIAGLKVEDLMGGQELWFFLQQMSGGRVVRLQEVESMEVAFMVPKDVTTLTVRIPASVKGDVTLAPAK